MSFISHGELDEEKAFEHSDRIDDKQEIEDRDNGSLSDDTNDLEAERIALRIIDWHILPMVFLFYIFSFLDRTNIGNGRLYGLEEDLHLQGTQFQTATSVFFATYVASEIPSSIFLKKLRPSRFLSACAILWGIIASLTGLTQTYSSLIACRVLLGVVEGPLFPCFILYLTMFYTRKELAVRGGYIFGGSALAGAVGGLLAYGVGYMDGARGMRAWRWLLIIEGIPSVCLGIFGFFYLADSPASAWYLSPPQRKLIQLRRTRNEPEAQTPSAQTLHRADVLAAFRDWKTWVFCVQNFGGVLQLFSLTLFLPTIIHALNPKWSTVDVQALTVPCYIWSTLVYFIAAFASDALQHRAAFGILGVVASVIGHAMLIEGSGVAVQYVGCYFVSTGIFIVSAIALVWLPTLLPRYGKRSTATGMQLMIGNSAGAASPYLYPTNDSPRFVKGHAVTIALLTLSAICSGILWWALARTNRRRKAGKEDWKIVGLTEEQINDLGDESPRFFYAT